MDENKCRAEEAAKAMATVYVLEAVVGALECGTASGYLIGKEAANIIRIAKKGRDRILSIYDRNIAGIK